MTDLPIVECFESGIGVFLFRRHFAVIPAEFSEAVQIDGAHRA